jgi:hypothetical protein
VGWRPLAPGWQEAWQRLAHYRPRPASFILPFLSYLLSYVIMPLYPEAKATGAATAPSASSSQPYSLPAVQLRHGGFWFCRRSCLCLTEEVPIWPFQTTKPLCSLC